MYLRNIKGKRGKCGKCGKCGKYCAYVQYIHRPARLVRQVQCTPLTLFPTPDLASIRFFSPEIVGLHPNAAPTRNPSPSP